MINSTGVNKNSTNEKTNIIEYTKVFKDSDYIQKNIEAYENLRKRDYLTARNLFKECVNISRELEDDYKFSDSLANFGITQFFSGKIKDSIENLESAYRISLNIFSNQDQVKILLHLKIISNLVLGFLSIGKVSECLSYLNLILETIENLRDSHNENIFYLKSVLFIFFRVESIVNYVQIYHKYSFNIKEKVVVNPENKDRIETNGMIINRILFFMHKMLRENDLEIWIQCLNEEAENLKLLKDYNGFIFALYNQYSALYAKNPELNSNLAKRKIASLNKILLGDKEKLQNEEKNIEKILNEMKAKLETSIIIYRKLFELENKLLQNSETLGIRNENINSSFHKNKPGTKVFLKIFLRHAMRCLDNLQENCLDQEHKVYLSQMLAQIKITNDLVENDEINLSPQQIHKIDPELYNSILCLLENISLIRYKFKLKNYFQELRFETLGYRSKKDLKYIKQLNFETWMSKNLQNICEGSTLTKINFKSSGKKEHFYKFNQVDNSINVYEKKTSKSFKTIFLNDIKKFSYGIVSENLKKRFKNMKSSNLNAPWLFFSIILKDKSLDFYLEENQLINWFYGIKKILQDNNSEYKLISVNNFLLTRMKFRLLQRLKEENSNNIEDKYKHLVSEILSGICFLIF
jgi:hypothetical protein